MVVVNPGEEILAEHVNEKIVKSGDSFTIDPDNQMVVTRDGPSGTTPGPLWTLNQANTGDNQHTLLIVQASTIFGPYALSASSASQVGTSLFSASGGGGAQHAVARFENNTEGTSQNYVVLGAYPLTNTWGATNYFYRQLPPAQTDNPVMKVHQANAADDQPALQVQNQGTRGAINLVPVTSDPSSPVAGDIWYNSTDNQFKGYNGTSVVILG